MSEPEGLLVEGARVAVAGARDLWWRVRPATEAPRLPLGRVRQRLELLLSALFRERVSILPADPEPAPTWLARLLGRAPGHLVSAGARAATDGRHVWLPRALDARDGEPAALDRYRLLAVEQAARMVRGFARAHPHDAPRVERDLYWVAAADAVDRGLARDLPGLAPGLRAARRAALAARPLLERLTPAERVLEGIVRDALAGEPASPARAGLDTPDEARAWARAQVQRLRSAGRYRGVAPVPLWGELRYPGSMPGPRKGKPPDASPPRPGRTAVLRRPPRVRPAGDDEDDASPGMWMVRFDDPMESVEDPMGLQRPSDHDDTAEPGELGDALSDLPEARMVRTPGSPREVLQSDATSLPRVGGDAGPRPGASGITYPEWDHRLGAYRFPGAIVRPGPAPAGAVEWAERVLDRRATLVRQVRRRFDGLRPRRVRLGRQPDGADPDLDAYVTAFADRRAGEPGDDRLYITSRPARRDLAIAVLADVSASTDAWVAGSLRIVDVEKEALVILLEALDALGDRHAVLAFSGEGPGAVHVLTVKAFDEAPRTAARRRIAALEPDGYTRVGAAVRHASAVLGRERARHRLLLLLSDGKPNDVDEYAGRYGIEDTRQAVAEARLQGLLPFCLTVDREAPAYLPAIFGPRGFAVLSRPERLPTVLVEVIRSLVTT
jgi:nitric oxide reductase NorD protein